MISHKIENTLVQLSEVGTTGTIKVTRGAAKGHKVTMTATGLHTDEGLLEYVELVSKMLGANVVPAFKEALAKRNTITL